MEAKHVDLFQHGGTVADFICLCKPNACGGFLRHCFVSRKETLYEFTELNFCLLVPRTLYIYIYID